MKRCGVKAESRPISQQSRALGLLAGMGEVLVCPINTLFWRTHETDVNKQSHVCSHQQG